MKYFEICAHRGGDFGCKKILSNTIRAFEETRAICGDKIETDVCLSKDNEPIICHPGLWNPDPPRLTWKEIKNLYPFIPHFKDLLDYFKRTRMFKCFLDIKVNSEELVGKICDGILEAKLSEKIILTAPRKRIGIAGLYADGRLLTYAQGRGRECVEQSLGNYSGRILTHVIDVWPVDMARTAEQLEPDYISFGWLNDSRLSRLAFNLIFKIKVVDPFIELADEIRKAKAKVFGMKVFGGIANTEEEIRYLLDAGVDGIVTDYPALAVQIRESKTL